MVYELVLAVRTVDTTQFVFLLIPLFASLPLIKEPTIYLFLAKDLAVDQKLAEAVLAIINSAGWTAASVSGKKALLQPLMAKILAASQSGKIGFWCAYLELLFCASSEADIAAVTTLLKYHISTNLSAMTEVKLSIERKTDFCFRFATKPPVQRESFERCVQASMDIMYEKSLKKSGRPNLVFAGGVPDVLRDSWHRAFEECLNAKSDSARARKCRMAAALRSEFLFFAEAPENNGK